VKTLLALILLSGASFPEGLLALDLPMLAGRFHFTLVHSDGRKDQVGEIEICYLKDFNFPYSAVGYEALKFENERIAVIKDKSGKSMISRDSLDAQCPTNLFKLDAKETAGSISAQPEAYTRLRLEATDADNLTLSITHKRGALNIGPHISLFHVWPDEPTTTIYLKRAKRSADGKSSAKPEPLPNNLQAGWPKFEQ